MDGMELILPGEITSPTWPGNRCKKCGRPMGGDQVFEGWATCNDVPQACTKMEDVPRHLIDKHYFDRVWSNANRDGLVAAIHWMTTLDNELGGKPLDLCEAGRGSEVLEKQYRDNPGWLRELAGGRGML